MSGLRPGWARGPIQEAMAEGLARGGGRLALAGGGEAVQSALTYAELEARIRAASRALCAVLGAAVPRHVGFRLGNRPGYVVAYFATLAAGHLPLLLDAGFNTGEIDSIRRDCGLDALVVERPDALGAALPGQAEAVPLAEGVVLLPLARLGEPAPRPPRPSTQVCRFTSGTTGRPKCLEFSGEAVVAAARNWILGTAMTGGDRTLCLAALSNGLAFNTSLLSTFLAGGELHFLSGAPLSRVVAGRIARTGITRLVAFPTLYRNFVAAGGPDAANLAGLRCAISAGAPLWPDVREEFRVRYGIDISDYYGIAETGPCTFERDPGYHSGLGEPLPGVEIRIEPPEGGAAGAADPVDTGAGRADIGAAGVATEAPAGRVLVRSASMASGYLNHPGLLEERVDAAGFYHSGDRGRIVDGRLHLVGRTEDHINVAGRKVDPNEIVAVVAALAGVDDAVAFPDDDSNRETLVHLVVAAAPGGPVTRAAVVAACRERLAPYKVPGRISFVPAIPRTGIGKPRIALIREQLGAGGGAGAGAPGASPAPAPV